MTSTSENDRPHETRRSFCLQTCRVVSAAAFAGVLSTMLEGCSNPVGPGNVGALPTINASVASRSVLVPIDSNSPLSTIGAAALIQSSLGLFLVARTGDSSFTALGSTCTHQVCTITGFGKQTYVCPCHGSQFDLNGRVVAGPANLSLPQYATAFSGNVLTISV